MPEIGYIDEGGVARTISNGSVLLHHNGKQLRLFCQLEENLHWNYWHGSSLVYDSNNINEHLKYKVFRTKSKSIMFWRHLKCWTFWNKESNRTVFVSVDILITQIACQIINIRRKYKKQILYKVNASAELWRLELLSVVPPSQEPDFKQQIHSYLSLM